MECRKRGAWTLAFACMACHAQATVNLHPPHLPLPRSTAQGHFRFEGARRGSQRARNFGEGVARTVAQQHKMTGGPIIEYGSQDRHCKFDRDPTCPSRGGCHRVHPL